MYFRDGAVTFHQFIYILKSSWIENTKVTLNYVDEYFFLNESNTKGDKLSTVHFLSSLLWFPFIDFECSFLYYEWFRVACNVCVTVTDPQYPCAGVVQCTCSLDAFDEILVAVLRFETRTGLDINIIRKSHYWSVVIWYGQYSQTVSIPAAYILETRVWFLARPIVCILNCIVNETWLYDSILTLVETQTSCTLLSKRKQDFYLPDQRQQLVVDAMPYIFLQSLVL